MKSDARRMVAPWLHHSCILLQQERSMQVYSRAAGWSDQKVVIPCHIHPMSSHLKTRNFLSPRHILIRFWKFFIALFAPFLKNFSNHVSITEISWQWVSQMNCGQCGNATSQFVFNPLPNNFFCCPHSGSGFCWFSLRVTLTIFSQLLPVGK